MKKNITKNKNIFLIAILSITLVLIYFYFSIDSENNILRAANLAPGLQSISKQFDVMSDSNGNLSYVSMAGTVINYAGNTAPAGYLLCDGSLVSRTVYSELFTAIGTIYGNGDNTTTFALPDLRGRFIRGLDSGANVDSGRVLGSKQDDSLQQHGHNMYRGDGGGGEGPQTRGDDDNGLIKMNGGFGNTYIREIFPGDVGGSIARVSGETRPKNVAMNMYIKY